MRSWSSTDVPTLPGDGSTPRVLDVASGELIAAGSRPRDGLYVCGITPYDATHLGHAATYLTFDTLVRVARDARTPLRYIQNVTDVDDPLLQRARATGEEWTALAERETELFRADMTALRVLPPDVFVGAVESIPLVVDLIGELQERGAVYSLDRDLYFSVASDPRFGAVSHLKHQDMLRLFAERGGDPSREGKRNPLDALLWLGNRAGEPAWESPWGSGRPGWHIECAAIALHHLRASLSVQGGGRDLVFPHHEMSAAHAQVVRDRPFADAYVHAGMIGLDGEKMSKSRGNLVLVSALLAAGEDPMAVRLALLNRHYRADWSWADVALADAHERLDLWRLAARHGRAERHVDDVEAGADVRGEVRARLADDLDTAGAIAAVDAWAAHSLATATSPAEAHAVAQVCDALLGIAL